MHAKHLISLSAALILIASFALMAAGCTQVVSPTSPSSLHPSGHSASLANVNPAAPLSAQSQSTPAADGVEVPLKGQFDGTAIWSDFNPFVMPVHGDARGTASHLGRFALTFAYNYDL